MKEKETMVKHVLFVKLKDKADAPKVKALFESMKEHIDLIQELQVGIDYLDSPRSYDVVLEMVVASKEALEAYQAHPYHVNEVKPFIHAVRSGSATVDYEF